MRDKPTYWEYKHFEQNGFIRIKDGRYFKAESNRKASRVLKTLGIISLVLLVILLVFNRQISDLFLWPNLFTDFTVLCLLLMHGLLWLRYRLSRFSLIEDGSPDAEVARSQEFPKQRRFRWVSPIFTLALCVFLLMNSYSALLLRSLIEQDSKFVSVTAKIGTEKKLSIMDLEILPLKDESTDVKINLTIAGTPQIAVFFLNGQLLSYNDDPTYDDIDDYVSALVSDFESEAVQPATNDADRYTSYRFIWDDDYFTCHYYLSLPEARDGSVLTMDCGELHREWTFRLEDKA